MKIPIISYETNKIKLIPFNKELVENDEYGSNYYKWFENQEVCKHNSHGLFQMSKSEFDSYFKSIEDKKNLVFAIMLKDDYWNSRCKRGDMLINPLKHIGNVSLQGFNWINRSCEVAIIIGEPFIYGHSIGTESIKLITNHGFNKLNMTRIWSGTASTNKGMQKVFEKLGYKKEGKFKNGTYLNGKYEDVICYAILKKQWSKLNDR